MFDTKRFLLGLIFGAVTTAAYVVATTEPDTYHAATHSDEFHIHADFVMAVGAERVTLSDEQYMSEGIQELHPNVHLHNNNQDVIHVHAEGITLAEFLSSLGFTLTNDCLTLDSGETYCSDETQKLTLYVNDTEVSDIVGYEMADEDKVLLYYGEQRAENIEPFLAAISNDACIYSGTCPERGAPPPESCGLTCEI